MDEEYIEKIIKLDDVETFSSLPSIPLFIYNRYTCHRACHYGAIKIISFYLSKGIDITMNYNGLTALHFAISAGHVDLVKLLISNGFSYHLIQFYEFIGILACVELSLMNDNPEMILYFWNILCGSRNSFKVGCKSVLMNAAERGYEKTTKILLQNYNYDLDYQDESGETALHYACRKSRENIIRMLLDAGANKYISDNTGVNSVNKAALYCPHLLPMLLD